MRVVSKLSTALKRWVIKNADGLAYGLAFFFLAVWTLILGAALWDVLWADINFLELLRWLESGATSGIYSSG